MPTMTMRELRDTRKLKAWLRAGKSIELRDRNNVIGRIVPPEKSVSSPEWPDFEALAKEISEGRVLPGADLLIEDRGRY